MKVKIDKNGYLSFERAGNMKLQACPFYKDSSACGDWCPLFNIEHIDNDPYAMTYEINLCQKSYTIKEKDFTDERTNRLNNSE